MKNSNVPQCNTISNEVKVDLDVFGALVLNWIRGHIDRAHVVTENNGGTGKRPVKLLEKLAEPTSFSDGVGDDTILGLSARARDGVLSLGGPRDQIVTEEDTVARSGATCVRTTSPIRVGISNKTILRGGRKLETVVKCALDVSKNPPDQGQVLITWVVHVETNLLHSIGDVRAGERQVLKSTGEAPVF